MAIWAVLLQTHTWDVRATFRSSTGEFSIQNVHRLETILTNLAQQNISAAFQMHNGRRQLSQRVIPIVVLTKWMTSESYGVNRPQ
jgi:hypothetical protein